MYDERPKASAAVDTTSWSSLSVMSIFPINLGCFSVNDTYRFPERPFALSFSFSHELVWKKGLCQFYRCHMLSGYKLFSLKLIDPRNPDSAFNRTGLEDLDGVSVKYFPYVVDVTD